MNVLSGIEFIPKYDIIDTILLSHCIPRLVFIGDLSWRRPPGPQPAAWESTLDQGMSERGELEGGTFLQTAPDPSQGGVRLPLVILTLLGASVALLVESIDSLGSLFCDLL